MIIATVIIIIANVMYVYVSYLNLIIIVIEFLDLVHVI